LPLSNEELSIYEKRKPRLSLMVKAENVNESSYMNSNNNTGIFNETYNGDSFQDNPANDLDEEEMVLKDLESSNNNQNNIENQEIIADNQEPASIDSIIKDITVPDTPNPTSFRPILPKPTPPFNTKSDSSSSAAAFTNEEGKLKFVTSKVGHPMLVIDDYSFHKHSVNPKTGRVNWRCSRRRVRDIRCPSSCFTDNNENASIPTPHHVNCYPMSAAPADFMAARKRQSTSRPQFTNNNTPHLSNEFDETMDDYDTTNFDTTNSFYDTENVQFSKSNGNGCHDDYMNGYHDELETQSDVLDYPASEDNKPDEEYSVREYPNSEQTDEVLTEYNSSDYSTEPESFAKLIADLNDMKRRERMYRERLTNSDREIDRIKRSAMKTIQTLKWKSRMSEIDMYSLKASLHQKNTQNANLRKLVDEMMAKVGS